MTIRNITGFNDEIQFQSLIQEFPTIVGTTPANLGKLDGMEVTIKTADKSTIFYYFAAFITGTI
jgi:hypothetical protein